MIHSFTDRNRPATISEADWSFFLNSYPSETLTLCRGPAEFYQLTTHGKLFFHLLTLEEVSLRLRNLPARLPFDPLSPADETLDDLLRGL